MVAGIISPYELPDERLGLLEILRAIPPYEWWIAYSAEPEPDGADPDDD